MRLSGKLFIAGLTMLALANVYVLFAVFIVGPGSTWTPPIPLGLVLGFYKAYLVTIIILFTAALILRLKKK